MLGDDIVSGDQSAACWPEPLTPWTVDTSCGVGIDRGGRRTAGENSGNGGGNPLLFYQTIGPSIIALFDKKRGRPRRRPHRLLCHREGRLEAPTEAAAKGVVRPLPEVPFFQTFWMSIIGHQTGREPWGGARQGSLAIILSRFRRCIVTRSACESAEPRPGPLARRPSRPIQVPTSGENEHPERPRQQGARNKASTTQSTR